MSFQFRDFGFIDLPLILLSAMYFGLISTVSFKVVSNCFKKPKRLRHSIQESNTKREVIIVRGVPGVGKDKFVKFNESSSKNSYAVVSTDDYFKRDKKYVFDRTKVNNAESYCFNQFHTYLQFLVPKVYVTNVNSCLWMYSNYIKLAESYGYKIRVVELICNDVNELKYFNSRSRYNVPINYSKKIYSEWEDDPNAEYYEPYMGDENGHLAGDSIPFPEITKDELDEELEEYMKNKENCDIETDDEDTLEDDENILDKHAESNGCVTLIDNEDTRTIGERQVKIKARKHKKHDEKLVYQIEMGEQFDKIIKNSSYSHYYESF